MKVEAISSGNSGGAVLEAQYVRRIELMEMARKKVDTVEENQESEKSEHYDSRFKREEVEGKREKLETSEDKIKFYEDEKEKASSNKLNFSVNEETGRVIIQVVDSESGEVVREIPPEEMIERMDKLRKGYTLLMDKKV